MSLEPLASTLPCGLIFTENTAAPWPVRSMVGASSDDVRGTAPASSPASARESAATSCWSSRGRFGAGAGTSAVSAMAPRETFWVFDGCSARVQRGKEAPGRAAAGVREGLAPRAAHRRRARRPPPVAVVFRTVPNTTNAYGFLNTYVRRRHTRVPPGALPGRSKGRRCDAWLACALSAAAPRAARFCSWQRNGGALGRVRARRAGQLPAPKRDVSR